MTARFWGWSENDREFKRDLEELSQRAKEGKPLYGSSNQPEWVQHAAASNSTFSQLMFCEHPQLLSVWPSLTLLIFSSWFAYVRPSLPLHRPQFLTDFTGSTL